MPSTYTLISSNVLSSSAASVTFSAIPSTYTDLVLRISARTDQASAVASNVYIRFNGTAGTVYSSTLVTSDGTTVYPDRMANTSLIYLYSVTGAGATSNTFGNAEVYVPSYTVSQNKPLSIFQVLESNSASVSDNPTITAGLWRNTDAITQVSLTPNGNFVTGSSFYLYGIKNS